MLEERNGNVKQSTVVSKQYLLPPKPNKKLLKENRVNQDRLCKSFELAVNQISNKDMFNITETNKVKKTYLKRILSHQLDKSKGNMRENCLKNHTISPEVRIRMVSLSG